jgi:membrane-bound lytic murein transglycosylase A
MHVYLLIIWVALFSSGCSVLQGPPASPGKPAEPISPPVVVPEIRPAQPDQPPTQPTTGEPGKPTTPLTVEPGKPAPVVMPWLKPALWWQLPGWADDDLTLAWPAFMQSCRGLKSNPAWIAVCQAATSQAPLPDGPAIRAFFEQFFSPWQINQAEGGVEGLVTGYYEPLLHGSRIASARYRYPIHSAPDDLLVVDLSNLYPELKNLRLRGRLQGNKIVPYFSRAEIEAGSAPVRGKELVWVDDAVDLFFLQIQGSGRVQLENGETLRIGYADQNGHPYRSIGKWLVDKGELTLDKASMQGIKDWGRRNPERLPELLNANPSYVFFRELPNHLSGPLGALGVPLTAERSIAIDPRGMPLGAPVWLATTRPNSAETLNRLVLAQDTGGAIRGNVRADFFWGFGDEAGKQAGAMKQRGRMWVLLPRDFPLTNPAINP